ncbi:MAG TPA: hypothetical protein VFR11_10290, partial [Micromonosporaceae bacterium]|nr:hypothetical protein [Micromonosporaceae bacterium]
MADAEPPLAGADGGPVTAPNPGDGLAAAPSCPVPVALWLQAPSDIVSVAAASAMTSAVRWVERVAGKGMGGSPRSVSLRMVFVPARHAHRAVGCPTFSCPRSPPQTSPGRLAYE